METLADLVAAGRSRDGPVIEAPDRSAPYSYREFSTNTWKAGNLLRHYGVRRGATAAVVVGPKRPSATDEPGRLGAAADPLLAVFGAWTVGATVDLAPAAPVEARALVAPAAWLDRYEAAPGCSRLAYGGPPEAADVAHFERDLWSENPIEPPDAVEPGDTALRIDGETATQGALLAAGRAVADEFSLAAGDRVAVDAPLRTPEAVVAGVVAPLVAGATILPAGVGEADPVAVVTDDPDADGRVIRPATAVDWSDTRRV